MAENDRDSNEPGAAGNAQNGWSANVRTAEQLVAEQQAKFDALRAPENNGPVESEEQ